MLQPFAQPLLCHRSKARAHEYQVGCCFKEDGCNSNITLKLDEIPKSSMIFHPEGPNIGVLSVLILLPIILLSICIVSGYFFWRRYQCFGIRNKSDR